MTSEDRGDGFILIDVLAATTILALAGSTVLLIGNAAMSRASSDLDRSVALVTVEGLLAEVQLAGVDAVATILPHERGQLRFDITRDAGTSLQTISAYFANEGDEAIVALEVAEPADLPGGVGL